MEPSRIIAYCHVPMIASTAWMLGFTKMNRFLNEIDQRKFQNIRYAQIMNLPLN